MFESRHSKKKKKRLCDLQIPRQACHVDLLSFFFVICFFRWSSKLSSSWKMIERVVGQGSWWYSMWGLSSAISLVLAMLLLTSSCWWDPSSTQTKCVRINCNKFAPTPCQFSFSFFCFSNRTVKMLPIFCFDLQFVPSRLAFL